LAIDIDIDSVDGMTVARLKEHLSELGLQRSGLKADLAKRLKEALSDSSLAGEGGDDEIYEADSVDEADEVGHDEESEADSGSGEEDAEVFEAEFDDVVFEAEILEAEMVDDDESESVADDADLLAEMDGDEVEDGDLVIDEAPSRPKKKSPALKKSQKQKSAKKASGRRVPSSKPTLLEGAISREILDDAREEDGSEPSERGDLETIVERQKLAGESRLSRIKSSPMTMAAALIVVLLLVGAGWYQWMQGSQSFSAEPLRYGDQMSFTLTDGTLQASGEDMVKLIRDRAGGALDDACGELSLTYSGTGEVAIRKGETSDISFPSDRRFVGAIEANDAYGRVMLAAEQTLSYDLLVDLEGQTWSTVEPSKCGSMTWSLDRNELDATVTSYTELTERIVFRTDSEFAFTTAEGVRSEVEAVSFGGTGVAAFDQLLPMILKPTSPLPLYDYFELTVLEEGVSGEQDDWIWVVGADIKKNGERVVPVQMEHKEIGRCLGHARISLLLREGSPWPIEQSVDILLAKDRKSADCGFFMSTAMDLAFPDGQLKIVYTMTETGSASGDRLIDWNQIYSARPSVGFDIPPDSDKERWVNHMPDNSTSRPFTLEGAVSCLASGDPNSIKSTVEEGGYLWRVESDRSGPDVWNLTWVDPDGDAGWVRVQDAGGGNCTVLEDIRLSEEDSPSPNRGAIPDTLTLKKLESRILSTSRYPTLQAHIADGSDWNGATNIGVLLTVAEDSEWLDLLPGDIRAGQVSMYGNREWVESGQDVTASFLIDAETARMVGWSVVRNDQ